VLDSKFHDGGFPISQTLTWGRRSRCHRHDDDRRVPRRSIWCEQVPVLGSSGTLLCTLPVRTPGSCRWMNCREVFRCLCST